MKKLLALVVLVAIAFVVIEREQLFVRDPLGSVTRDGVKENGAQVYINFSNDVLIENDHPPMYVMLVQHGQHAGGPKLLHCAHYLACLTDADVATLLPLTANVTVEAMNSKQVRYQSGSQEVLVNLR